MSVTTLINTQNPPPINFVNNYQALKGVKCINPLNNEDQETLLMVRQILEKRNAIDRFGVSLLRAPLKVGEDEILVETTDEEGRIQKITPMSVNQLIRKQGTEKMMFTGFHFDWHHNEPVMSLACFWDGKHHWPLH